MSSLAHEKGVLAGVYNEKTYELLIKYFDTEHDNPKYVLSNAFIKTKKPKTTKKSQERIQFPFTLSMVSRLTYVTVSTVIFTKGLGHIKAVALIRRESLEIIIILPCLLFYKIFLICITLLTVRIIPKSLSVTLAVV